MFTISHSDFSITKINRFADGTFGIILTCDKDPENRLSHVGTRSYLTRVMKNRYGITNLILR